MKVHGISRKFDFFEFQKHYCPKCKERLKKVKVSKVVNSKSPDAKYYDFMMGGFFSRKMMIGNVKFIKPEFFCEKCNKQYKIGELKKLYFKKK